MKLKRKASWSWLLGWMVGLFVKKQFSSPSINDQERRGVEWMLLLMLLSVGHSVKCRFSKEKRRTANVGQLGQPRWMTTEQKVTTHRAPTRSDRGLRGSRVALLLRFAVQLDATAVETVSQLKHAISFHCTHPSIQPSIIIHDNRQGKKAGWLDVRSIE